MLKPNPIKKQLKKYAYFCSTDEEFQNKLLNLSAVMKTKEWEVIVQLLWGIKNQMATELLEDRSFTEMAPDEKDRIQTVYSNINEWINFLTNPIGWIGKKGLLQTISSNLFKGEVPKPERKRQ